MEESDEAPTGRDHGGADASRRLRAILAYILLKGNVGIAAGGEPLPSRRPVARDRRDAGRFPTSRRKSAPK